MLGTTDIDFLLPAPILAPRLLGVELLFDNCGGIIVETEAYTADDPASHSYRGITPRNAAMFMQPSTIYIYSIYGVHRCFNIVCGNKNGQAVLIRALMPTKGISIIRERRSHAADEQLLNGPAKLVQGLALPRTLNGQLLQNSGITLRTPARGLAYKQTPRVGITKGLELPWRYVAELY